MEEKSFCSLVYTVNCHTTSLCSELCYHLMFCYFRSLCNVLCNARWSKTQLWNWWGYHLDILQKLDLRKATNTSDALIPCVLWAPSVPYVKCRRRDHWSSVFLYMREIKQFLDSTVLCYVINNTEWWRLFRHNCTVFIMICV